MKRIGSILPELPVRARAEATLARLAVSLFCIAAALTAAPHPAAAVTVCFDKAEQSKLVADNEIVPVSAALKARKAQKRGKLVEAEVCRNQKGFYYKMTMQSDAGEVRVVRVRAAPSAATPDFNLKRNCYYTGYSWSVGSICKLECTGDQCPRQYCKANGEWQPLARCEASSCQAYRSC